jgi:hypothetical protein
MVGFMRFFVFLIAALLLGRGVAFAGDAVPATTYFPVLPYDATPDAAPQLVPVASNHPMQGIQAGVTRAIIVIHDESRDANGALATLSALAGSTNASTMILAPQFLLPSDLARFAKSLPGQGRVFATWQIAGWPAGDDAAPAQTQKGVSSFTVVDLLLMYLADRNMFPDLRTVVVAGFGAGANFVQRYAAFGMAADIIGKQNIDMRYAVADASSYLYQTANRNLGGRKGFGKPDSATCPDYDAYPYGLEKLNPYARRVGANAAKTDYVTRFVTYLYTATPDAIPESNCAALAQGADSRARAVNYKTYLQSLYGDVASRTQIFAETKDAASDAVGLYGSTCGMAVLFGDGLCVHTFGESP